MFTTMTEILCWFYKSLPIFIFQHFIMQHSLIDDQIDLGMHKK